MGKGVHGSREVSETRRGRVHEILTENASPEIANVFYAFRYSAMISPSVRAILIVVTACLALPTAGFAAEVAAPPGVLKIVVKPVRPFAFEENGELLGYTIDLWKRIAAEAGLQFEMKTVDSIPGLIELVRTGQADVGMGAISITPEREKLLDFSHPFYESGLQVLARSSGNNGGLAAFQVLLTGEIWKVCGIILLTVLAVSNVLWFFERRINPESFPEGYRKGIGESVWWAVATLISGGCENKAPVGIAGRVVAIVWMIGGIFLTAFITASLSAAMTATTLSNEVADVSDLRGSSVGTIAGSSSESYLTRAAFNVVGFRTVEDAIAALEAGRVRGVVYDEPILRYYLATNPGLKLRLTGPTFDRSAYGFALPIGSPNRKIINEAFLKLQVDGGLQELDRRWFAILEE